MTSSKTPSRNLLALFVLVALLRGVLGSAGVHGGAQTVADEFQFGFEQGHIAGNLARGLGYSVKFGDAPPIPTAWASPLYPLMLAGLFKLFGVFTFDAAIAVIWLNALLHGGIAVLMWLMARRLAPAQPRVAALAIAMFIILPPGWQFLHWAWCIHLLAFLVMLHLYVLVHEFRAAAIRAAAAGLTLGLAMLTDGAAIMIAPITLVALFDAARTDTAKTPIRPRFVVPFAACALAWLLTMSPWMIRNGRELGSYSPLRGMLGAALWMGNHPATAAEDYHGVAENPWHNPAAAQRFIALGERGFDVDCKARFMDELRRDPLRFAQSTAMRTTGFWLSEWWIGWRGYPWNLTFGTVLSTLLCAGGALMAMRTRDPWRLLVAVIVLFPLPYYITFLSFGRYRFPIEPVMYLLSAGWLDAVLSRASQLHTSSPVGTA